MLVCASVHGKNLVKQAVAKDYAICSILSFKSRNLVCNVGLVETRDLCCGPGKIFYEQHCYKMHMTGKMFQVDYNISKMPGFPHMS